MRSLMKKAVMANDHGAVQLAGEIKEYLEKQGWEVNWLGTKTEDSVDYPDMAEKACREYLGGGYEFGVLCCGTGIGISMAANKINGIRCALPQNCYAAAKTREHNNANFIAFGGRIDYPENPLSMLQAYLDAEPSSEPRHLNRQAKLMSLEKKN